MVHAFLIVSVQLRVVAMVHSHFGTFTGLTSGLGLLVSASTSFTVAYLSFGARCLTALTPGLGCLTALTPGLGCLTALTSGLGCLTALTPGLGCLTALTPGLGCLRTLTSGLGLPYGSYVWTWMP